MAPALRAEENFRSQRQWDEDRESPGTVSMAAPARCRGMLSMAVVPGSGPGKVTFLTLLFPRWFCKAP